MSLFDEEAMFLDLAEEPLTSLPEPGPVLGDGDLREMSWPSEFAALPSGYRFTDRFGRPRVAFGRALSHDSRAFRRAAERFARANP